MDRYLGLTHDVFVMPKLDYKERLTQVKVKGKAPVKEAPRPKTAEKKGSKKKGDKAPKDPYPDYGEFKTLSAQLVPEWVNHEMYMHLADKLKDFPTRAAPGLKNWNVYEIQRWGLEGIEKGTRCYIYLTDQANVLKIVKNPKKDPVIYATCRVELNGLHTLEWYFHCKIYMEHKHETIRRVSSRLIKHWRNGKPQPLPPKTPADYAEWPEVFPQGETVESNVVCRE
jgi:hypothetical protein